MVVLWWSKCERGQSDLDAIAYIILHTYQYMVFKECGQSKRVHSKKRERETQIEGLKNGARIPGFGTRYIHTVEGY